MGKRGSKELKIDWEKSLEEIEKKGEKRYEKQEEGKFESMFLFSVKA